MAFDRRSSVERHQPWNLPLQKNVCIGPVLAPETTMSDAPQDASEMAAAYERLEKDMTAVKKDIAYLSQQIAEAANSLAVLAQSQTARGVKNARANADSIVSNASDRVGAVAVAAQDAAASMRDMLEETIQERPLATVAIALGFGFLIGVTWRR